MLWKSLEVWIGSRAALANEWVAQSAVGGDVGGARCTRWLHPRPHHFTGASALYRCLLFMIIVERVMTRKAIKKWSNPQLSRKSTRSRVLEYWWGSTHRPTRVHQFLYQATLKDIHNRFGRTKLTSTKSVLKTSSAKNKVCFGEHSPQNHSWTRLCSKRPSTPYPAVVQIAPSAHMPPGENELIYISNRIEAKFYRPRMLANYCRISYTD